MSAAPAPSKSMPSAEPHTGWTLALAVIGVFMTALDTARRRLERTRHRPVLEQALDTKVPAEKQQVAELPEEGSSVSCSSRPTRPAQSSSSGLKEAQMLHPTLALALATDHMEDLKRAAARAHTMRLVSISHRRPLGAVAGIDRASSETRRASSLMAEEAPMSTCVPAADRRPRHRLHARLRPRARARAKRMTHPTSGDSSQGQPLFEEAADQDMARADIVR